MHEDIIKLKNEFKRIKNMGFIKSLRKGTTGLGYTFETLINKSEDSECKPDFGTVEIKCKLGYTKTDLTLFSCVPKRNNISAVNYIFEKYSYYRYNNYNTYRLFHRKLFCKYALEINDYKFYLKVDYYNQELIMQSYKNDVYVEDVCKWNFSELKEKLEQKLYTLAIVTGYPYTIDNELYYKYVKIDFYRLKSIFDFLYLIEIGKIHIEMYLREGVNKLGDYKIENHGISFVIKRDSIEDLFYKLKY